MLSRIAETVTPIGLLIVDGYVPDQDWLPADDLLVPLSVSQGLRVLWFGDAAPANSAFFDQLVAVGSIIPDSRRLAEVVALLKASGQLDTTAAATPDQPGIVSFADGRFFEVTPALRLRVEASAAIVDDTWTRSPTERDPDYFAFERFHGDLGGPRSLVEGIALVV
jgi:hypothetical protein